MPPVLAVICGLPGTGKSTIASALATRRRTAYLRVDRIEQTITAWSALSHPVGPVGYAVAYALAAEQLSHGVDIIVECVNPLSLTRDSWASTAATAAAALVEAEVICSDAAEHRRRVETRQSDVDGLTKPTWAQVLAREYEPWRRDHIILDSARLLPNDAADMISAEIDEQRARPSGGECSAHSCR